MTEIRVSGTRSSVELGGAGHTFNIQSIRTAKTREVVMGIGPPPEDLTWNVYWLDTETGDLYVYEYE